MGAALSAVMKSQENWDESSAESPATAASPRPGHTVMWQPARMWRGSALRLKLHLFYFIMAPDMPDVQRRSRKGLPLHEKAKVLFNKERKRSRMARLLW